MLVDVIWTKRRKCITGINTRSNECLERKKESGSRKTTNKGLVTWKLWPWIYHIRYLGRKIGSNEAGKEDSPCEAFKLLWILGVYVC